MRRSEVLGLGWQHVDLDAGLLFVERTLYSRGREVYFGRPKSLRSNRPVALTPRLVAALKRRRLVQNETRLARGANWADLGMVFDRADGQPIHPDVLSQYFGRLTDRLGFGGVRLHDLRHAFATNLIGKVGTKDTSAALGHASEMFTTRVYQHRPQEASTKAAAQAIAEVYGD